MWMLCHKSEWAARGYWPCGSIFFVAVGGVELQRHFADFGYKFG